MGAPEQFGLATALETLVAGWSEHFQIAADFHRTENATLPLSLDVATNVYSLVQEALHNIAKHARAHHMEVSLQEGDGEAVLMVTDDGCGFDMDHALRRSATNASLGLVSMRERATLSGATLDIDSVVGHGTTLVVTIPLPHTEGASPAF